MVGRGKRQKEKEERISDPRNVKRLLIPVKPFVFSLVTATSDVGGAHIDTPGPESIVTPRKLHRHGRKWMDVRIWPSHH
uniref:Uncharacterized protein n=1 Tax=Vespula pensylvanica TaxID=30213 RepID=A0A834K1R3_VESPE|nr:hypothetical protein H0235_016253 [Vespula pensylvanica]